MTTILSVTGNFLVYSSSAFIALCLLVILYFRLSKTIDNETKLLVAIKLGAFALSAGVSTLIGMALIYLSGFFK